MKKGKNSIINWRIIIGAVVSVMALFFVYFQRDTINKSIDALQSASWNYVLLAIVAYSFTVIAAAAVIFKLRLVDKMRYIDLLIVQTSTLFLGRITPASVGGLAAMGRVLFTQGHTVVQSGTVVAAGGVATFMGNVLLSVVALLLSFNTMSLQSINIPKFIVYIFIVISMALIALMFIKKIRLKILKVFQEVIVTLRHYEQKKQSIVWAIFYGLMVTLCFSLTLMLTAKSLGVNLSLFEAIITVSLGSLGVAVTPLPGGVIGAEAALAATLAQFGVPADLGLAIAFVYRFIIFWLPLLPGYIASQYALKKELL